MKGARAVNRLCFGDTIGLFSPSEPLTDDRKKRMLPNIDLLGRNYTLKWAQNAFQNTYYQAGSIDDRIKDINELIADPNVRALMATWGGKNGSHLIPYLPYEKISKRRIPIIGFSDTCVLLNPISVYSDIITFYGPNVVGKLNESEHFTLSDLQDGVYPPFGKSAKDEWTTIKEGCVEGILYGGNLSTFTIALSGSDCLRKMKDVIFFWESSGDPPQIIDQYLTGLHNAGFFDRVKAMIVGVTIYTEESYKNRPFNDLLKEFAERYNIPVIRINTFGHCKTENPIIPIGASVRINTFEKEICLQYPVVR